MRVTKKEKLHFAIDTAARAGDVKEALGDVHSDATITSIEFLEEPSAGAPARLLIEAEITKPSAWS